MTQRQSGPSQSYDAAIIGAGPAGAATATYMARAGLRVALLDRATFPRDKPCAEYLSPAVEPLLADLGVLDDIEASHPARLRGFRVFTADGRMFQGDFAGATTGQSGARFQTGLAVTRRKLDAALVRAAGSAGATVLEGRRVSGLDWEADARLWRLSTGSGGAEEQLTARVLVGADGVHSLVARRLGLRQESRMRKVAIVAHVRGIESLGDYGEMHIANHRYVGLAPLEQHESDPICNVAMVVDERREARALAGQPQEYLLSALKTFPCLRDRVSALTIVRPALTTSRMCARVRRLSTEGALLAGDAAGYYDPFTGEGIYRALRSAQLASDTAVRALKCGDVSAGRLYAYDRAYVSAFRGKRAVEMVIQAAVQSPLLMRYVAARLEKRKRLADIVVGITGDFLSPAVALRPEFLLGLLV